MIKDFFTKFPHCLATYVTIAIAVGLLGFSWRPKLKPVETHDFTDVSEATKGALAHAKLIGGRVHVVSNTRSMRPLLQGGELVVVSDPQKDPWSNVTEGDVCVYAYAYHENPLIHRAAMRDAHGWIMAGDSAPRSESFDRMTPENYLGRLVAIYRVK